MRKKRFCSFILTLTLITTSILNAEIAASASDGVTIKRDGFGMPAIKGGTLKEIAHAIGYVQAQDRLWQIFFTVQLANGRAAQYFGEDLIDSDILQHQLNYTNEEVKNQIDAYFTIKTKKFYKNFVRGLNEYVDTVNENVSKMPFELRAIGFGRSNPIPHFTFYDILRTNQFILQQFSPSSIPTYQIDNLSDFEVLVENFGFAQAKKIFNDINPTTKQVKSQFTIVPGDVNLLEEEEEPLALETRDVALVESSKQVAKMAKDLSKKMHAIQKSYTKKIPGLGSNGQAISAQKSLSGNPMIRIAPQPNYNQPSDFYQVRIEKNNIGLRGNYFTIPTFPMTPNGIFNNYGVGVQVGHLPSNDFLFEPVANATLVRTDTIQILDEEPLELPIYRSASGGWVITYPITADTETIVTLRSVYIDKQLRAINALLESAFATNHSEFVNTFLNPAWQADILLLEGDYVDSSNNISAFHTGGWTKLDSMYDRRLPQGVANNPIPSNAVYSYDNIAKNPLLDTNTPQGYYVGWNSLFKQGAEGSGDTLDPVGLNRMFWLDQYIRSFTKLSFDDLKNIGLRQYLANSNTAFHVDDPDKDADLFAILFKERFFQAVNNIPTPERLQAVALLQDFEGNWFDGDLDNILNGLNVSDPRILSSVWLNAVANRVLNPYLDGTTREVAIATPSDPIPLENAYGSTNELVNQANTLSRIFNLAFDNTLFFNGWLNDQPSIDEIITQELDFALSTLGGFSARPWGEGKRGVYEFENLVLGVVQEMPMCNVSGCILMAEFTPLEIKMESILALGQSGEILGNPNGTPKFNKHCFDQQPLFSQLQLRTNPPFKIND